MIVLLGPLAAPDLCAALDVTGAAVTLRGRLSGGARAGIDAGNWPVLSPGDDALAGIAVPLSARLVRYAAVMGLRDLDWQGHRVLGVTQADTPVADTPEDPAAPALRAQIAHQIALADPATPPDALAARLPMIGTWAASRMRAQAAVPPDGITDLRPRDAVRVLTRSQPFAGFFAVQRQDLTHARHAGGQAGPIRREALISGDAAVLLPWDPRRDRVLVIEQFRFAPHLRGDPQPWLLEPIAGRVDAGETPEAAILREAQEEAGLTVTALHPACHVYPSPGALCEFLYHYIGIADLPDGVQGIHGLASESEDIRGHLLDRAALGAMVRAGAIRNGPLALLSLWLDARAPDLRAALAGEPGPGPGRSG